jgi:hypothetical protein
MPTTTPLIPSRIRIGNITCERLTVRSRISPLKPGAKTGITIGAKTTKRAVIAPSTIVTNSSRVEARRKASRYCFLPSSSVKTGTNAGCSAASANSARTRFGTWKAIVKADIGPLIP